MKICFPFSVFRNLLWIFLLGAFVSCKKAETSSNNVILSFNDSIPATCQAVFRPGYDYIGGPNCEFEFDRTGRFATGETVDIGLFAGYHCDLMTSPLPYQTHLFSVTIVVNPHPWETVAYSYNKGVSPDTTHDSPGDLILTLTERDNNRVR